MTHVKESILCLLNTKRTIRGTEQITIALFDGVYAKPLVIKRLRELQAEGKITIIPSPGGRGRKTIYKRNRNSPGMRRKVR